MPVITFISHIRAYISCPEGFRGLRYSKEEDRGFWRTVPVDKILSVLDGKRFTNELKNYVVVVIEGAEPCVVLVDGKDHSPVEFKFIANCNRSQLEEHGLMPCPKIMATLDDISCFWDFHSLERREIHD